MKYYIAVVLSLITGLVYAYLYYNRVCHLDGNAVVGIAASVFTLVLTVVLVLRVLQLQPNELGQLADYKTTVILALVMMIFYTSMNLFESFYTKLPPKIC